MTAPLKPWPMRFHLDVDHVYDGDTIVGIIRADAGLGIYIALTDWRCRLYGIDAPELRTSLGAASRDALQTVVKPGDTLDLESWSFDKYGRRIDAVPYTADGVDLCDWMVTNGHAVLI
jgi:endonuclease YncB( thermonuclease family)